MKSSNFNIRIGVKSQQTKRLNVPLIDPELVIHTLTRWQMEGKQSNPKELDFLIKHTLRTLVKKGNIQALGLLGFNANPDIKITAFHIDNCLILNTFSQCRAFGFE
jgi:3-methyladenine DNA glycosylase AlkC